MTNINNDTRRSFFPNSKTARAKEVAKKKYEQNKMGQQATKQKFQGEPVSVDITEEVRDFSRIKELAGNAPTLDNSDKIARLKQQIDSGTYEIDYDKLADKLLLQEFN